MIRQHPMHHIMLSNSQPVSYLIFVKQSLQGKECYFHFIDEETGALRDLARDYMTKRMMFPFQKSLF